MKNPLDRRRFLASAAAGAGAAVVTSTARGEEAAPALLGGPPVRREPFPSWPRSGRLEEEGLLGVLRSGKWFRGGGDRVDHFETSFAAMTGAAHCVAVANGTSALVTSLAALGIGPGDEVIVPVYTFIATVNAVLLHYAMPVFVDTDPETFQIDARKVEAAITDRTAAIMPVHLGGNVADMDAILEIGRRRKIPVVEDACQAHLAEWRGKKVGTMGAAGCFSFQVSKNLSSGEGGAILTGDADLAGRCYAFQNNNRGRAAEGYTFSYQGGRGANLRLTEFQGSLLLAQMTRLEEQSRTREQNARYLTGLLEEIPGIRPARQYEGCTRNAYHLYMFRFKADLFGGLSRDRFLQALQAEGIPCSGGYAPLNKDGSVSAAIASKGFGRIYPRELLDGFAARNACPANDALCGEAVWFTQNMLLGPRADMDQIAAAVRKVRANVGALAKA
ncbi:L-glutamine:scyllo-inosose aminotransferase [Aquisphaera giovannonii]|uniref:L-glutamine:scyllo-inosose aminotransferase n=1 Tax=Aquisphaera giovannonii TaxID=406548 RepID=A0A5B9WAX4_9BACT|nr:DegT/DnrJ/EryC1/StrS family aminotransferase [Aquisphaera giovannonii]QEH37692.1 L-glutamine:scyllo-inosose aminotransferase [Aquisphaera giovannonii]